MLFDLEPKERKRDLFDRQAEFAELAGSVGSIKSGEKLTVIYGVRRVGKTSLIRAFLNEKETPYISIDASDIYSEDGYVSLPSVCNRVIGGFESLLNTLGLDSTGVFDSDSYDSLTATLRKINEWCNSRSMHFVIVFDEAQYLRFGGKTKYDGIIAWSLDNLRNIAYILSGSEVGMLRDFLKYEDVKAPLYGRFRNEIALDRFDGDKGREFLVKGFDEYGLKADRGELDDTMAKIDGIVGWLTYYGHYRCEKKLPHKAAIEMVYSEGSKVVMGEVNNLLSKSRRRYLHMLKAIAEGISSWAEIKAYVGAKTGRIPDNRFAALLESLLKFGFVQREGASYRLIDPVLLHTMKKLRV